MYIYKLTWHEMGGRFPLYSLDGDPVLGHTGRAADSFQIESDLA